MIHNDGTASTGTAAGPSFRGGGYHADTAGGAERPTGEGISTMPYLTKYHLTEQQASALLGPVADTVAELERRTHHFAERLAMSQADHAAVLAAHEVLAAARAEIERIWAGSVVGQDVRSQ